MKDASNQNLRAGSSSLNWTRKSGLNINRQNKMVYLSIVLILGIITILSLAGIIGLSCSGKQIPESLISLGSGAAGALGSLITSLK